MDLNTLLATLIASQSAKSQPQPQPQPDGMAALVAALTAAQGAKPEPQPQPQPDGMAALVAALTAAQAKPEPQKSDTDVMAALVQAISGGGNNGTDVPNLAPTGLPLTHAAVGSMTPDQINAAWDKVIAPQVA